MSKYKDTAKQMVIDYLDLEKITINNNRGIPHTELGELYNIDKSYAGNLWRGVRMGILQRSDDTKYGRAVKQMYKDNIVDNIDNMTYTDVDNLYNIQGNAGMTLLLGLEATKFHNKKNEIPSGITEEFIRKAAIDFDDNIIIHNFGKSTTYDVIIDGKRYPPKAIVGIAASYILGKPLSNQDFKGGLNTKCFSVLTENNFKIILKSKDIIHPDDVSEKEKYIEGAVRKVIVNRYERDDKARDKCIEYYGLKCQVCSIDFGERYGELGSGFIHVHHLIKISDIGEEYEIDPIKDLIPVCPNCHSMLHKKNPPLSIEDLKKVLN